MAGKLDVDPQQPENAALECELRCLYATPRRRSSTGSAAHEHELAAVAAAHNQVLCIAALFGLVAPGRGLSPDPAEGNRGARRARHR